VILTGLEAEESRVESIFKNVHRTSNGIPCLWPQWPPGFKGYPIGYHNGQIWPFVQGYWAWAASSKGKVGIFSSELSNLVSLANQSGTFGEFYQTDGTLSFGDNTRRRQLWSAAGYLSMIYHGLFGMEFRVDEIMFDPVVPNTFDTLKLERVKHRDMLLDITIYGPGIKVKSFLLDGDRKEQPVVSSSLKGKHKIEIYLTGIEKDN